MAQQVDAIMGHFEEEFEDPNAGVDDPEDEDSKPGVVGKILTSFNQVKQRVSKHGSTPTTPTGVEAQQQHESRGNQGTAEEVVLSQQQSPLDAKSVNTAGAGRPGGNDDVEKSPFGGLPTRTSARSVESAVSSPRGTGHSRDEGTPASPKVPRSDLGERIIHKLPGSHMNPYAVGATNAHPTNPTSEDDRSAVPTSPSGHRSSGPSSPSIVGKLKNLVTGQRPKRGTGTDNATAATAGTTSEQQPLTHGYAEGPHPEKSGDIYERAKIKLGHKGPDEGSAETWPSPSMPDIGSIPSATRTDVEGKPIEGPTQPKSEDTKKEGLMTKIMDKLHIHEKSTTPRATAADIGTVGTPNNDTVTSSSPGGPGTTVGTATGPTEN